VVNDSYTTTEDTTLDVPAAGVLANDSDVDGDTLSAILVSQPTHGVLTLNPNGGFSYVPATNYNGSDSFTYKANDGQADSGIATVSITITGEANVPPTVTIISPADGTLFISPTDIKIVANATDLDGTISQVEFFQGTNSLATTSVEIAPSLYSTLWTNVAPGTYQLTAKATDDEGATAVSAPVKVTVIDCMPVSSETPQFNPQTSLFEQKVRVTNPTAFSLSAVKVSISGLRQGVQVFNASGDLEGVPFVKYDKELGAGETADFTIEYYVTDRQSFEAQLCAKPVLKSSPIQQEGTPVKIDRAIWLADGSFMIEFSAVPGQVYYIQYGDDMRTWKTVTPGGTSSANRIQWIDNGQPKTESFPSKQSSRFYRVITAQ